MTPTRRGAERSAILAVQGLGKRFGETTAVRDVSFTVDRGEFVALLGPSGCGKTTTLSMIAGFLEADTGDIHLNGVSVTHVPPYRRSTAMVFQSYALFPHLTIFANIAFGLRMRRVPRVDIEDRVRRVARLVRLDSLLGRYPSQLSGGQQQRAALARALVVEPDLLLLDEPLSNLDAKLREDLRVELRSLQRSLGFTAVLVTHDQTEALSICDRIIVMCGGAIEQIGTPAEIYDRPATPFVAEFVGKVNGFPSRLEGTEGDRDTFLVGDALRVRLPHEPGRRPGETGRLLARPERIRVSAEPTPGGVTFRGRVARVTFLGGTVEYLLESDAGPVTVTEARLSDRLIETGVNVWGSVAERDLIFLADRTGDP